MFPYVQVDTWRVILILNWCRFKFIWAWCAKAVCMSIAGILTFIQKNTYFLLKCYKLFIFQLTLMKGTKGFNLFGVSLRKKLFDFLKYHLCLNILYYFYISLSSSLLVSPLLKGRIWYHKKEVRSRLFYYVDCWYCIIFCKKCRQEQNIHSFIQGRR